MDALLKLLSSKILPEKNLLPESHREAKNVLSTVGMEYHAIHCCPKGCCLFRGEELENATHCKCGQARYRDDTMGNNIPAKVLRWFPIIPRLKHYYGRTRFAELMSWHASEAAKSPPGVMRYIHDSPAWKKINEDYPEFASDPRNIRFGLAVDGINPYKLMRAKYSTWPVLLINYNIPPWLAIKRAHVMLVMIVPGNLQLNFLLQLAYVYLRRITSL
jgi:Transposase family tnp2